MSKAVIVGGGIGGLAAALALSRQGHRAVVLERAPEFAEIGAGIQIAPNGIHALDRLGLGRAVRASAVHMAELRFMDGVTGDHVVSLPLTEEYQRRFGNPYVVVHRAELHTLLLEACLASDAVELRGSSAVVGYEQDGRTATVLLESGERITGDGVIGADGIHSAIRQQLVGDGPPRISGITVYRAVIPMEQVPEELRWSTSVTWWAGPHCHFVHYPIAGGKYLNLAASSDNGATEATAGVPVSEEFVRREFGALGPSAHRLLELGEGWKSWVLVDRDPVDDWTDGRVTLLGDAAHPMLHYAAQGACQALEDAVLLGELLDCSADEFPQRFEKYNAERRLRTARVQLAARESIRLWHPAGQDAVARNALLSSLSARELHDQVAWMHGVREFGQQQEADRQHHIRSTVEKGKRI
ncbi:3-hydroxybenzoate 6-monooxygenase [Peterkaempfera bronchialis]|uniref:3-hydroxybenzoate 6-monooxygenase n=1 Tax=Peterkaempfera bronchialis TaxID=2126346 RepID=A0A345SXN7_9ACTN|nr:3-hydroxybenzoate 6-monooxygenase [Peterkaempfera bronchialis]AXI78492.1 3-hydroxybenzoate 6-monooxygenase [Peterkaempfera bronchialis]